MNQAEAKQIAHQHLAELQKDCPVEISFNDEITEDHPIGYVFFYNSVKFWETRDVMDTLAGNGPMLVRKDDGSASSLPSHQSVEASLEELVS